MSDTINHLFAVFVPEVKEVKPFVGVRQCHLCQAVSELLCQIGCLLCTRQGGVDVQFLCLDMIAVVRFLEDESEDDRAAQSDAQLEHTCG